MDFKPIVSNQLESMDSRLLLHEPMELLKQITDRPLPDRLSYDADNNLFFVNFEGMSINSMDTIDIIREEVVTRLEGIGHKVKAIVNYDNFYISPELLDTYTAMVSEVVERFYLEVTRYSTSSFLRLKLGKALEDRGVAPHIFETRVDDTE